MTPAHEARLHLLPCADTDRLVEPCHLRRLWRLRAHARLQHDWNELSDDGQQRLYTELTTNLMNEAKQVLNAEGIGWNWNGDIGTRILLTNAEYFARLR